MFSFEKNKSYNLMMINGGSIPLCYEDARGLSNLPANTAIIFGKYIGMPESTNIQVRLSEIAAVAEMSEVDVKRFEEAGKKQHEHYEQQMARLNAGQAPGSYI